jgi:hypothetical protein
MVELEATPRWYLAFEYLNIIIVLALTEIG